MTSSPRSRRPTTSPGRSRRPTAHRIGARAVLSAVGLVALLGLTACAPAADDAASDPAESAASGAAQDGSGASAPPTVTVTPAADAAAVNPAQPVVVRLDAGELTGVTLTASSTGKTVDGELSEDKREWRASGPLEFNESYTVEHTARSGDEERSGRSSFSTVDAAHEADVSLNVEDGQTYGVWQVVEFEFSEPVTHKDAVEKAVTVDGAHEKGRFRWYSDQKLRFRPEKTWTPNSTVKVSANILGTDLGNGMIGNGNKTVTFTTGPEQRAYVDNTTKTLVAYVDGKETERWPVTLGDPEWPSTTGKKVILEQAASYPFKASSLNLKPGDPHYYPPFDATNVSRLTWSGEFVHQALPSAWPLLGVANVSHGCVGMPPEGAKYVFDVFRPGDMVEVVNTDYPQPDPADGYGDWNIPFEHYADENWHGNW